MLNCRKRKNIPDTLILFTHYTTMTISTYVTTTTTTATATTTRK